MFLTGIRDFSHYKQKNYLMLFQIVSCYVIRAGFKPATPTSVVWYSIQLSYGTDNPYRICDCKVTTFLCCDQIKTRFFSKKMRFCDKCLYFRYLEMSRCATMPTHISPKPTAK